MNKKVLRKSAKQVSKRSGLSKAVCRGMLGAGWVYVEEINRTPRWDHPTAHARHVPLPS